jgi:two-component sensor histidine kinase
MTRSSSRVGSDLHFDIEVPNDPLSIGVVRKAVTAAAEHRGQETTEIVGLVFTELVTNALVHGELGPGDRIGVEFTISDQGVSGSVSDPGAGFDLGPQGPQPRADGGFGLFIVQRLVRRWGADRAENRTRVWFEL